jgi:hypothetical protein
MSNYFDDIEVQKRIRRQYRRRFVLRLHFIVTVIALIGVMIDQYRRGYDLFLLYLNNAPIILLVFVMPVALHYLWLRYREQMEGAVDREMKTAFEYRKRKHENATYLTDDGELWQEEAFQQEKRKRLME